MASLLVYSAISCVTHDIVKEEESVLFLEIDGDIGTITYEQILISGEIVAKLDGKVCEDLNKIAAENSDEGTQALFVTNNSMMLPVSKELAITSGSILQLNLTTRDSGFLSIRISEGTTILKNYTFKVENGVPLSVVYEYDGPE